MDQPSTSPTSVTPQFTFRTIVALPLVAVIVLQLSLGVTLFAGGRVFERMDKAAYDLMDQYVVSRASYIENDMVMRWAPPSTLITLITEDAQQFLASRDLKSSDFSTGSSISIELLDEITNDLLMFIRHNEADGVYFFMNDGNDSGEVSAIYLRDSNPNISVVNDNDIMLAVCPSSIAKRLNLAFDSHWEPTFTLEPRGNAGSEFFYQPLDAANRYPTADSSDLGYWGKPAHLGWTGSPSITYSLPIRDTDGTVIGILGTETQMKHVTDMLPYDELGHNGNGSYLFGVSTNAVSEDSTDKSSENPSSNDRTSETVDFAIAGSTGGSQSLYTNNDGILTVTTPADGYPYAAPNADSTVEDDAVVAISTLSLYNTTSPFANEQWAVLGLVRSSQLFERSHALMNSILVAFVATVIVGIITSLLLLTYVSKRVSQLMNELNNTHQGNDIHFTHTNITEIDALSDAVSHLGNELAEASARLSTILRMSDRNLGAFECNRDTDEIEYTDNFIPTLLQLNTTEIIHLRPSMEAGILSSAELRSIFDGFTPYMIQEAPHHYALTDEDGKSWLRLVLTIDDERHRIFGLLEDITTEMRTRQRIEYERDHDVLTGLSNRRAFEMNAEAQINSGKLNFGAMLLFDLDNLKYVNDTYGHDYGDMYINLAAKAVNCVFEGKGLYCRVSGDEFMVFVTACSEKEEVIELLHTFKTALRECVLHSPDGNELKVGASLGVAFFPEDAQDFAMLRKYADFAMYMAKYNSKGELVVFDKASYNENSVMSYSKKDLRLIDEKVRALNTSTQSADEVYRERSRHADERKIHPDDRAASRPTDQGSNTDHAS